jgi:hypothetical protein
MNNEQQQIIDEAYDNYCNHFLGYDDTHVKEVFVFECKTNPDFSEKWGLKIEERELSLNERYELVRVNGLCPKYSFEIENGKPVPNKFSQSEWYDKYNIPTRLITITYKDTKIESYE